MAKSIATIGGVALAPGVSLNGRMYTRPAIAKMVTRAQERIKSGDMPLSMLTHHAASDDSSRIAGRVTGMTLDDDGAARFTASIADTDHGRTIAALADTGDGPAFLKNVSIRGWWAGTVRKVKGPDGEPVETADDLELDGLDFTKSPGVAQAGLDTFAWADRTGRTETTERVPLTESVQEARVTITDEAVPATEPAGLSDRLDALRDTFGLVEHVLDDGLCVTCPQVTEAGQPMGKRTSGIQGPGGPYADPGYQADKKPRYQLDTRQHAVSAWQFINKAANAKAYSAAQLKRIKSRILAALKKFGVKTSSSESWAAGQVALTEHFGDDSGSFSVSLNNGALCVTVSSYSVDPCDLDVIGTAAMNAACLALGAMDPDMDGDIDVDGADSEDDDGDNGDQVKYTPPMDRESAPGGGDVTVETTEDPAPDLAAEPHTETEVPAMADTDKTAVEATPAAAATEAAPAAPQMVTFTTEQFAQLMATRPAAAEAAPAAEAPAVTETEDDKIAALVAAGIAEAVKGLAPAAVAEPVAETTEQKIARLVEAGVTEAKQALVASGAVDLSRRGIVRMATETATGGALQFNEHGQPSTWPNKPLHKYSTEELAQYAGPVMDHWIMKGRAVTDLD